MPRAGAIRITKLDDSRVMTFFILYFPTRTSIYIATSSTFRICHDVTFFSGIKPIVQYIFSLVIHFIPVHRTTQPSISFFNVYPLIAAQDSS